jgi:hypothetical protein
MVFDPDTGRDLSEATCSSEALHKSIRCDLAAAAAPFSAPAGTTAATTTTTSSAWLRLLSDA